MVEVRILGPIEVVVDSRPVAIGSAQLRRLLAALAVSADTVVSTDRLVDILWGEGAPMHAPSTLAKCVFRLRSAMGGSGSGGEFLMTKPPGYVLQLNEQLDAHQFATRVSDARACVSGADPTRARELLDEALAMWHGPALGEFANDEFARAEVARLDGLRATALEERGDIKLSLGEHAELIDELQQTIATYPLRERFRGQLMLALYRAHRQPEALRAYNEFRSLLVGEIGLEPSLSLQQLDQAIAGQSRELDWSPLGPAVVASSRTAPQIDLPTPRQTIETVVRLPLPAALVIDRAPFVGRKADLEWLDTLWRRVRNGENCVALLFGPEGAGKSRLVAEFARRAHASGVDVVRNDDATGVMGAVAATPGGSPAIVVLDELIETDDITSILTEVATRRTDVAQLIIAVLTTRIEVKEDLRAAVGELALVASRDLDGLSADEVGALLARSGEQPSTELVEAVLAETGGRPGLVAEIAGHLREREAARRVERALRRADDVRAELDSVEEDIAAGVLERGRATAVPVGLARNTCPYKGLARFDAADAEYFFGRDRLVASLVTSLATAPIVGVIGASGSGKSSLVRAGLIPALARDCLPGSSAWPVRIVRPGAEPLTRLESEVGGLDLDSAARLAVRGLAPGARMLLVVDQFEELFTLCSDDAARAAFIAALANLDAQESPASVVITLRADYYGSCAAYPALARLLERHQALVGAMTSSELRDAIVEPARHTGLAVEPSLVESIVSDVADQPGMLPLVSTALLETWARRDGTTMTVTAYDSVGGVRGALARLADRTYASLQPAEQETARRIFLRLAQLGEGNDDVSRRATRRELGSDETTTAVLNALIESRLLTADGDTVEVAHEALLREWPRLRSWLEQDRDGRRLHRQLTDAAAQWDTDGRDPSALYRGARLSAANEWALSHAADPNPSERDFLDASSALDQQEARRARHTARRLRELAVGLSILLVIALAAGSLALVQRQNADRQASRAQTTARQAQAGRLTTLARTLGNDQTDLALLLGLEGHRLDPSLATEGGIEGALVHVPPGIEHVVETGSAIGGATISADGRLLAAPKLDGSVQIWDLTTGQRLRSMQGAAATTISALFNPDASLVMIGHSDGTVEVWDVATGKVSGVPIKVGSVYAFGTFASADGSRIMTIGPTGTDQTQFQAIEWDRRDPVHPSRVGDPFLFLMPPFATPASSSTFDGQLFIEGNSLSPPTRLYDLGSHQLLAELPIHSLRAGPPDGNSVAGVDGDRIVLVNSRTGEPEGDPFPALSSGVPDFVTVSPDGRQLAATDAARNGTIVVYDVATRTQTASIALHNGAEPTAFLPDGRLAITAGSQELIWRPGVTVPPIGVSLGAPTGPLFGSWSADGRTIVTFDVEPKLSAAGTPPMYTFDGVTGAPQGQLLDDRAPGLGFSPWGVALSPDGSIAAVAQPDGMIHLWKRATGEQLAVLDGHRAGGELGVSWSPGGNRVATVGVDQVALLWDVSDVRHPQLVGPLTAPGGVFQLPPNVQVEFSRDGRTALVDNVPLGQLALFDVDTREQKWTADLGSFAGPGLLGYNDRHELALTTGGYGVSTGRRLVLLDDRTGQATRTLTLPDVGAGGELLRGGRLLVVAGTESAAPGSIGQAPLAVYRLFDAETGAQLGEPIPVGETSMDPQFGRYGYVTGTMLASSDTNRFISGPSTDGQSVVLWDVDLSHWEASACNIAGRNLTQTEWKQYVPGQPYHVTCPQWPAGE